MTRISVAHQDAADINEMISDKLLKLALQTGSFLVFVLSFAKLLADIRRPACMHSLQVGIICPKQ